MPAKTINGMDVGVFQILADKPTGDPAVVAKRAEELGFGSYWVPEHGIIPEGSCDAYPGKESDDPPPEYLFKMPDPYIALARASGVTSTIGLGTGIALVAERSPLLGAKEIASLDHFSGGRVLYGIGAGWNEAECTVMGGDFPRRWTQSKEAVAAMRLLWSGEYVEHHGKYYDFPRVLCQPKPARSIPVLLASVGNNRVYKRVGSWGDGWIPLVDKPEDMIEGKTEICKYAAAAGRDPDALKFIMFARDGMYRDRASLEEAAAAGATTSIIWLRGTDEQETLAHLEELAATLF